MRGSKCERRVQEGVTVMTDESVLRTYRVRDILPEDLSSLAFVVLLASLVLVGVVGSDEIHPLICLMLYCLSLAGGLSRFESCKVMEIKPGPPSEQERDAARRLCQPPTGIVTTMWWCLRLPIH